MKRKITNRSISKQNLKAKLKKIAKELNEMSKLQLSLWPIVAWLVADLLDDGVVNGSIVGILALT